MTPNWPVRISPGICAEILRSGAPLIFQGCWTHRMETWGSWGVIWQGVWVNGSMEKGFAVGWEPGACRPGLSSWVRLGLQADVPLDFAILWAHEVLFVLQAVWVGFLTLVSKWMVTPKAHVQPSHDSKFRAYLHQDAAHEAFCKSSDGADFVMIDLLHILDSTLC